MARIRQVKPELFDDPDLGELPATVRWLFAGLFTQADRAGRLVDDPKRLKTRLCAYDDTNVDAALDQLAAGRFVERYQVDGKRYIQIRTFLRHQKPHPKEPESTYPKNTQQNAKAATDHGEPEKAGPSSADSGILVLGSGSLGSGIGGAGSSGSSGNGAPPAPAAPRATRTAVQNGGVGAGSYPRDHLRCVQPCGRVCLPDTLFAEFIRAAGGTDPVAHVHAFHHRINAAWGDEGPKAGQPIGDDKFVFWRARWREEQGTTVTTTEGPARSMFPPGTSTAELTEQLRESLQEKRR